MVEDATARLAPLLSDDDRPAAEAGRLARLMALFLELPPPPDPLDLFPLYDALAAVFAGEVRGGDPERIEESFLRLYEHVHGREAPYTTAERERMDETGGYWCHAGGLSPVLRAGDWIGPETVSADFGAGNGLQGLLMQRLYPHAKTVQIEISARMIECGRALQEWLGIPGDRVEWIADDVCNHGPRGIDFAYLYRPVRPTTPDGRAFYERFAAEVAASDRPVTVFSIADCLRDFMPPSVRMFYTDGHLTCFRYEPG